MDCPFIPGHTYRTRDPDVTFEVGTINSESGLVFGCEYHSMGGYVGPASRLLNGRVSNETEPLRDLVAEELGDKK